ncbi:MAG TPA: PDZ domain-containing protein [Pyrinomonadaceae bacterium]|jgi:membrane-associated protease RseP (regulator of RpoE activity)|nr:PDZ domain-containing protein [Pyrinomonadaceae bacterium]
METETQRTGKETTASAGANPQMCPSCGVALVEGMRFCRSCGYRLGEGMAEYVETVRFDRMTNAPGMGEGNQSPMGAQTTVMSPVAPVSPQSLSSGGGRRRKGKKWLVFLLIFVLFVPLVAVGGGFLFRAIRDAAQRSVGFQDQHNDEPRSFFGASEFGDTDGAGAIVEQAMPGSPAERAGLIDGDIITKFDGKLINGEDAMRDALSETPIGKTVEVVFLRDGETKTAQLTTVSSEEYDSDAFMPKERGMLGIEETERVAIEGTKIYGVRIGEVYPNRPADLAGIKEGDIVVEFDGKPVRTGEGLFGYINRAKPASTVDVVVYREGQRITIPVKMGRRT